jgi:predicted phosphoadenosine phosphosulfate sulfurtransferase
VSEMKFNVHRQPMTTQFVIATREEESRVRYSAIVKNGKARPSFAADSAEINCRMFKGTCFRAYFPP